MGIKKCFVIAPIGETGSATRARSDYIFSKVIAPAAEECGYEALRADMLPEPGIITTHVIAHLANDPLVIADLTDANPNVFYELAVRHTTGLPVIQLIEDGQRIPFDVRASRAISVCHKDDDSCRNARLEVVRQIGAVSTGSIQFDNPIPRWLSIHRPEIYTYDSPKAAYSVIPEVIAAHDCPGQREFYLAALHGGTGKEITNSYEDAQNEVYAAFDAAHLKMLRSQEPDRWLVKEIFNIVTEPLLDKKVRFLQETLHADGFELRTFSMPDTIPHLSPLIIGTDNVFLGLEDGKYRRVRKTIRLVSEKAVERAKEYFLSLWDHPNIFRLRTEIEIKYAEVERLRQQIKSR